MAEVPLDDPKPRFRRPRTQIRVLALPRVTLASLKSDSSYTDVLDLAQFSPDHFFYVALPAALKGQETPLPNVSHVFYDIPNDFVAQDRGLPMDLIRDFSRRGGRFMVDAVYGDRRVQGLQIGVGLSDFRRSCDVPVMMYENGVPDFPMGSPIENLTTGWAYAACHSAFCSEYDRKLAGEFVAYACSEGAVDRFWRNSMVFPMPVDLEKLDGIASSAARHEQPTAFVGMRFNPTKNVNLTFRILDAVFRMGLNFGVISTTPTSRLHGAKWVPESAWSWIEKVKWGCPRDDYLREAARCHVMVTAETDTSFPAYLAEQIHLGLVALVPKKEWPFIVVPEGYPFVYGSFEEGVSMLKWVLKHLPGAQAMMGPARERVRREFDIRKVVSGKASHLVRIANESRSEIARPRPGNLADCLLYTADSVCKALSRDRFTMAEFRVEFERHTRSKAMIPAPGANARIMTRLRKMSVWDIRETLHDHGFEDTCSSPYIVFERKEK